jgi:hypothetical protein
MDQERSTVEADGGRVDDSKREELLDPKRREAFGAPCHIRGARDACSSGLVRGRRSGRAMRQPLHI